MTTDGKVWIVVGSAGRYDDAYTFNVNSFTTRQAALDEASRLNEHVDTVNATLEPEYEDAGFKYYEDDASYDVEEVTLNVPFEANADVDITRHRERLAGMIAARESNPRLKAAYEEHKKRLQDRQ
jgi:hypothetical protein